LKSFGFNETAFTGEKHLIEKFPCRSCFDIFFKHCRFEAVNQKEKIKQAFYFVFHFIQVTKNSYI